MNKFKPYPAYKDSGVEWLGEVPEGWTMAPLKFNVTCNDSTLPDSTDEDYEIQYVEISDVDEVLGIMGHTNYKFSDAPSRARRCIKDGDVLISTVRTYLRAIAPVIKPPKNLIASTGFAVIRPKQDRFNGRYLGYLVRAEWWISEVIAHSVGVSYPAINASDLINFDAPVPDINTQTQIARFLDHETTRIDALIEEQQRLIALLQEKRQAVISHAVTKGLDPTVPMKDSGVEWLGEVPEGWDIAPLKFNATCNDSTLPDSTDEDYEIQYVEISDVDEISGIKGYTHYKFSDAPSRARRRLKDGDVLISTVRTYLRAIAPVNNPPENLIASTGFAVIRPQKDRLNGRYLGYLVRAEWWISEVIAHSVGVSYPAINASDLINLAISVPDLHTQTQIARFLDHETTRIDALIEEQQRLIELLQEKRQAVISHAVTGKIDVRDWQPPAPSKAHHAEEAELA